MFFLTMTAAALSSMEMFTAGSIAAVALYTGTTKIKMKKG